MKFRLRGALIWKSAGVSAEGSDLFGFWVFLMVVGVPFMSYLFKSQMRVGAWPFTLLPLVHRLIK